jgi:hypothetical protein
VCVTFIFNVCISSTSSGPSVCRICHSGEQSCAIAGEPLISPCNCRGSIGLYHRSCLERWLSSKAAHTCEICRYQYRVQRRARPVREVCLWGGCLFLNIRFVFCTVPHGTGL